MRSDNDSTTKVTGMATLKRLRGNLLLALAAALLLVGVAGCNTGGDASESEVNWVKNWDEALSQAQEENKPLMIDFYTDSCPGCRYLDSETFSNKELGDFLNDSVVPLKSKRGLPGLHLTEAIEYVPTVVFATPEGTEIGRIEAFRYPDAFRQEAEAILSRWEP